MPVFYADIGADSSYTATFTTQSSKEFNSKVRWKVSIILRVIQAGFSVLYIDADVILLKNPFPYLNGISGMELIAQGYRNGILCSGFMFFRPTNGTVALMKEAHRITLQQLSTADQYAINLARQRIRVSNMLLSPSLYPCGEDFFRKYQYYWEMNSLFASPD